ncbi:hypothetical protein HID58_047085 [Brassica napus]|uniref:Uncharacterized protein n=1 Tax=Brassica napus TaxID=3708 RepID=A0ABQ8AZ03_BRANA|nr:hypothetical protein HID58_047085 [Brassica napus]
MKGLGETQTGFFVGVTNLPKKKNVFRETLKLLLKKQRSVVFQGLWSSSLGSGLRNTRGWDDELRNMIDRSDVEEVAEDNLESVNSSVSYSDESSELIECGSYPSVVGQSKNRASLSFGHVYIKPVTDKLEEFRKASIAYVVMPLDDNTFQVAAASGNDRLHHLHVWGFSKVYTLAVCKKLKLNPLKYVDDCYTFERYYKTYEATFPLVPELSSWPEAHGLPRLFPPLM